MKYFLDTEFIEGFHKPFLGKRRHHIDLISIGITAEDGRELYCISNEFNPKDADPWVLKNVLDPMVQEWVMSYSGDPRNRILDMIEGKGQIGAIKVMQREIGLSNEHIRVMVLDFMGCWRDQFEWKVKDYMVPEVYAYYADYDWVVFCSLFGRMINLPKGFPMYCKDLKQELDEKVSRLRNSDFFTHFHEDRIMSFDEKLELVKAGHKYPKQENEHSAIDDARWNKKLYEFLQTI